MLSLVVQPYEDRPLVDEADTLPRELLRLFPRERELALIVYKLGIATAIDVERNLAEPLSNATVRTVLNRLAAKGVLMRRKCRGRRLFLYAPALTQPLALERTTRTLCNDFCGGSLDVLAHSLTDEFMIQSGLSPARLRSERLPEAVRELAPGLEEVASIIYRMAGSTISQIWSRRPAGRTLESIRYAVYELLARGIVARRRTGRRGEFIYLPAFVNEAVTAVAVGHWLADNFDGSPAAGLKFVLTLIEIDGVRRGEPLRLPASQGAEAHSRRRRAAVGGLWP